MREQVERLYRTAEGATLAQLALERAADVAKAEARDARVDLEAAHETIARQNSALARLALALTSRR